MRKTKADIFIESYCAEHNIKLLIDPAIDVDDGQCYPECREIRLGPKYSTSKIKLAIALHEISHINVERFKNKPYNAFECEFLAWMTAMKLHRKYFGKSFSKSQAEFMLTCLATYCASHEEFRKTNYSDNEEK